MSVLWTGGGQNYKEAEKNLSQQFGALCIAKCVNMCNI